MTEEESSTVAKTIIVGFCALVAFITLIVLIYQNKKNELIKEAIVQGSDPIAVSCAFDNLSHDQMLSLCSQAPKKDVNDVPPVNVHVTCDSTGKKKLDFESFESKDIPLHP